VSQVASSARYWRNAATFEPIPNLCRTCCHTPDRKMMLTPLSCQSGSLPRGLCLAAVEAVAALGHSPLLKAAVSDAAHAISGARAGPWNEGDAGNHDAAQATFRSCALGQKSSYSSPDGEECVEVITELPGWVVSETASSVLTAPCWPLPPRDGRPF
jgi:hypothetical protein